MQLREGFALAFLHVPRAVKRLKSLALAKLQQDLRPRDPVRALAVNQMSNDLGRTPSVFPFVALRPHFRQIPQKRGECSWSAREKRYRVLQVVLHRVPQSRTFRHFVIGRWRLQIGDFTTMNTEVTEERCALAAPYWHGQLLRFFPTSYEDPSHKYSFRRSGL